MVQIKTFGQSEATSLDDDVNSWLNVYNNIIEVKSITYNCFQGYFTCMVVYDFIEEDSKDGC